MGINRARRLWRQAGLGLPRKRPRRRLATSRPRPLPPRAANHVWAYDFVFDYCANGQQLKCLTVVDEFTHECLAIDVAGSIRSGRVIDVLTRLMSTHGAPAYLRSDSGPEFVSHAILQWLTDARIETAIIDPGKPWQNGTNDPSTASFAMNASASNGSAAAARPRSSSKPGGGTSTQCVHIRASPT